MTLDTKKILTRGVIVLTACIFVLRLGSTISDRGQQLQPHHRYLLSNEAHLFTPCSAEHNPSVCQQTLKLRQSISKKLAHTHQVSSYSEGTLDPHFSATSPNTKEPVEFAGFYECRDQGEAYSGAWLTSTKTFVEKTIDHEKVYSWGLNMEAASFIMLRNTRRVKSVDLFDFFVNHLSWYERLLSETTAAYGKPNDGSNVVTEAVIRRLKAQTKALNETSHHAPHQKNLKTVVLMPFFASKWTGKIGKDAGHSNHELRRQYLSACFWSFHSIFPHVVASTATAQDRDWLLQDSGLPFFDVITHNHPEKGPGVPKPSALGMATVVEAHRALQDKRASTILPDMSWGEFEYILYTESDQVIYLRDIGRLLHEAKKPKTLVLPHRQMPVPTRDDFFEGVEMVGYARKTAMKTKEHVEDLSRASCCFDRGQCQTRDHWKNLITPQVQLFTTLNSFAMVAGEGNFLRKSMRTCALNTTTRTSCV